MSLLLYLWYSSILTFNNILIISNLILLTTKNDIDAPMYPPHFIEWQDVHGTGLDSNLHAICWLPKRIFTRVIEL